MTTVNNNNNPLYTTTTTPTPAPTPAADKTETKQIHVTRELDGLNDTGILGEQLTKGTGAQQLAETNKLFLDSKYKVTSLMDTVNGAQSTTAVISGSTGILCGDEMYVAGDPLVGGKKNNYQPIEIKPNTGYYTMFEDGVDSGQKITVNAHVDEINDKGNTAFTEYGFTIQDDAAKKYTAIVSGGKVTITDPTGKSTDLVPPAQYTVGNPADPTAKFYFKDMPGGENGTTEPRLVVDYIEKPSTDVVNNLVKQGVSKADAEKLRTTTQMTFGFRVPDGLGNTYRMSGGVGNGAKLSESNNVKTYYDMNVSEGACHYVDASCTPPPPVAANERAKIWGDPHILVADDKTGGTTSYNFNEAGLYNLVKDSGVTANGSMIKVGNVSVMDQLGLTLGNSTVKVDQNFNVTVGKNGTSTALADGKSMDLGNGNSITRTGNTLKVVSPEYDFNVSTGTWSNVKYLNLEVLSKNGGVMSDNQAPSGLLGETFDADNVIEKAPKHDVASYVVSSLFANNNTAIGNAPGTRTVLPAADTRLAAIRAENLAWISRVSKARKKTT